MTLPYLLKLLLLCLASFFLIHLVLGLVIMLATPLAMRIAARMRPSAAARLLLTLRLVPAGFSAFIVACLCIPSYVWLEPRDATSEQAGLLSVFGSILAILVWAASMTRGVLAMTRSHRYLRHCLRAGYQTEIPEKLLPAWVIDGAASLFVIAGITKPRLFLSPDVVRVLSADQLAAAVQHERAHWISRDNLKRLLLLLVPDIVPFLGGFGPLERGWARFMERAADDLAVAGDAGRSLALATALVRVARLGVAARVPALMAPLLADNDDLTTRVDRLLNSPPAAETHQSRMPYLCAAALSASLAAAVLPPGMLSVVHRLLERLIQ